MLPRPVLKVIAPWFPEYLSGHVLHLRALEAAERGHWAEAQSRLEAAAEQYRREGEVEGLARLRVHQLMVRASATGEEASDTILEIVRRLNPLDTLESFEAPHALTDSRRVLSEWLSAREGDRAHATTGSPLEEDMARAA